jgi:hypothetical protein
MKSQLLRAGARFSLAANHTQVVIGSKIVSEKSCSLGSTVERTINMRKRLTPDLFAVLGLLLCLTAAPPLFAQARGSGFRIEEASITGIQNAIRSGQTSCQRVVQAYLERAKAYNGPCTALLTPDGAPIPP